MLAVLLARLLLGLAFVGEGLARGFEIVLELLPDAVELVVDERRRQLELVCRIQLIEQLALQLHARDAWSYSRLICAGHSSSKLLEAFGAERLGELVVDLGLHRRCNLLHLDVELGRLCRPAARHRIVVREGRRDDCAPRRPWRP